MKVVIMAAPSFLEFLYLKKKESYSGLHRDQINL